MILRISDSLILWYFDDYADQKGVKIMNLVLCGVVFDPLVSET